MKRPIISLTLILGLMLCANTGLANSADIASAVIDGKTSDRVHLREGPSADSKSLGLYFTGTVVRYMINTVNEWVWVNVGSETGYIKSDYLHFENDPGSVTPQQPIGIVNNTNGSNWANLRPDPNSKYDAIDKCYNGDAVTILGETVTHWYYVKAGEQYGYIMSSLITMGGGNNTGSAGNKAINPPAGGSASKITTVKADSKDSVQAYVTDKNCTLNIVPSDGTMVECTYDASVLRFEQSMTRGVHMLTVESISGKRIGDNAVATLYIPRALFNAVFVDIQNGEVSIAGGIDSFMDISGTDARVSVYYPSGNIYKYLMRFTNSTCVLGISENATDYAISVQRVTGSSINVPTGMPSNKGNGPNVGYEYVSGNGSTEITVDALNNSVLEFAFVR